MAVAVAALVVGASSMMRKGTPAKQLGRARTLIAGGQHRSAILGFAGGL